MEPVIKPANEAARTLLANLPQWLDSKRVSLGKFGVTNDSCIGIEIFRSNEAFKLGAAIGDTYGETRMASIGIRKILVFTEALAEY